MDVDIWCGIRWGFLILPQDGHRLWPIARFGARGALRPAVLCHPSSVGCFDFRSTVVVGCSHGLGTLFGWKLALRTEYHEDLCARFCGRFWRRSITKFGVWTCLWAPVLWHCNGFVHPVGCPICDTCFESFIVVDVRLGLLSSRSSCSFGFSTLFSMFLLWISQNAHVQRFYGVSRDLRRCSQCSCLVGTFNDFVVLIRVLMVIDLEYFSNFDDPLHCSIHHNLFTFQFALHLRSFIQEPMVPFLEFKIPGKACEFSVV